MKIDLVNLIPILSLFSVVLFSVLLLVLKKKQESNRYFIFHIANLGFIVFFFLLANFGVPWAKYFIPVLNISVLLIGPFMWRYIKEVVKGEGKVNWVKHLSLPIAYGLFIQALLLYVQYLPSSNSVNILTWSVRLGLTAVFLLHSIYYIWRCWILYSIHKNRIGEVFSYTEKVNLNWFKSHTLGYILFILGLIVVNVIPDDSSPFMNTFTDVSFDLLLFAYIVYSGIVALKQDPVFEDDEPLDLLPEPPTPETSSQFPDLKKQLEAYMTESKPFLDDSLTIHVLAKSLETNSKYLSTLINSEYQKSFVVYINELRIDFAKEMLRNNSHENLTIEAIGYESGFKSKSTFNTAFKKYTGVTPTVFLKEMNQT